MKNNILKALLGSVILLLPLITFGQTPNLGTTSTFALFTAAGAINNSGVSTIKGDIGTHAGAFNGFPPGVIVGQTHIADAVSAQASTDVLNAYNSMGAISCGSVIGVILGNNQTLLPGVYCTGAASTINGNLILDGGGNPNAVFIFKIGGALSTSTSSSVSLINGASLTFCGCCIRWILRKEMA